MTEFQLHCFGISHHRASVEVRERLRFTLFDIRALLASSRQHESPAAASQCAFSSVHEMVLVSTCNRVELYVRTECNVESPRSILAALVMEASREARRRAGLAPDDTWLAPGQLEHATYHYEGAEVLRHLCQVACGLDSMVLGETQILSQIRNAQDEAREAGLIGPVLSAVFRAAHRAGKRARTHTAISANPSSVSSAAVALAKDNVGDLKEREVAVVGLGEMGQLALKMLHGRGAGRVHIVNRTEGRAVALAEHIEHNTGVPCVAYGMDALPDVMQCADVLIAATGSSDFIIDADTVARVMGNRGGHELVVVDIGVPRNVDPRAARVTGFHLFDTDDIQAVQDNALDSRRKEVPKVMEIIEEEVARLNLLLRKLLLRPLITELRQKAEAIRQHELERTYQKLGSPDPETWSHVQHLSAALVKKLFHDPTTWIQEKAALGTADAYTATIRELFGLKKSR